VRILFLHGSWVGPWYWEGWVRLARERGHRAQALDFTGRWRAGDGIEELVGDVRRELGGGAVLVGHSFGGLVAQHVAARGGVQALVLVAPVSPRGMVDVPLRFQVRMARSVPSILLGRAFALRPGAARRLFLTRLDEETVQSAVERYTPGSGRAMRQAMLRRPRLDQAAIRCPVLVVAGEHDPFAPPRLLRRLAGRLGADFHEAPGAGHTVMLAAGSEATAARVLDWVEERAAGG